MRKISVILFALIAMTQAVAKVSFNIGTYNIRQENSSDYKAGNGWKQRAPYVADLLRFHGFDIFGTQEGFKNQLDDILDRLPGYAFIGSGRDDGAEKGEYCAIFYRTDLFDVVDKGDFWLSETPDRPGLGWDAMFTRICSWGRFRHRRSGREFIFMNVHTDHAGQVAQLKGARLVLEKAREINPSLPLIVTGDFNVTQSSEAYMAMARSGVVEDAFETARFNYSPNGTFNSYHTDRYTADRLDHVFVSPAINVNSYGVLTDTYRRIDNDGLCSARNPSDHYPVLVNIDLPATTVGCPRPEYPRPQFSRDEWVNLNGVWSYTFDFANSGVERHLYESTGFDDEIVVPFAPECSLSGVGHKDFINCIWYHRTVSIPESWKGRSIKLNFGAVYNNAEVYIDGHFVGRHFGGSPSFSLDITRFVSDSDSHNLVVRATSNLREARQGAGKQSLKQASQSCNYTRNTGIWQTVWMEPVDRSALERVQVITDIDRRMVEIRPSFLRPAAGCRFTATIYDGERKVASQSMPAGNIGSLTIPVKNMKLWSPDDPFLYTVIYEVTDADGNKVDQVSSYVGMRKIHTEGNRVYLNNKPYYQRLVLDQGYYPEGNWTAPSDEALRHDIELGKKAGFNGARLHQKVFEERYHYWADRLGYVTWGEFPSWGMDISDPVSARNMLSEWQECVVRDRNHPSIITWTPLNEEFWPDNLHTPRLQADIYDLTRQLDPTRPVNICSGGVNIARTDIWTNHDYTQDPDRFRAKVYDDGKLMHRKALNYKEINRNIGFNEVADTDIYEWPVYDGTVPYVFDEFGGIKWGLDQARQSVNSEQTSWGYGRPPQSLDEFYNRLEGQVKALLSLSDLVCGYCFTQLTDVEQEENGIYRYDRTPKFDITRIYEIFSHDPYR